jgi:hypothetical protein
LKGQFMGLEINRYSQPPNPYIVGFPAAPAPGFRPIPAIDISGLPIAQPSKEIVISGVERYPANTHAAFRRGLGELMVWQSIEEPPTQTPEMLLARIALGVVFSGQWHQAMGAYRAEILGSIPHDALNGGAVAPDLDHEASILAEVKFWETVQGIFLERGPDVDLEDLPEQLLTA